MRRAALPSLGLAPFLLALGLVACTPVRWEHPLTGTTRTQADLADCGHLAIQESWRSAPTDPLFNVPRVHRLPNGQTVYDPAPHFANDAYANTGELRSFCMRAKGYELVPAPPAEAP